MQFSSTLPPITQLTATIHHISLPLCHFVCVINPIPIKEMNLCDVMSEMSSRGQRQPTDLHSYENANIWLRQRPLQEEQLIGPNTGDQFLLSDL